MRKVDSYELGKMLCTEGGRELIYLLQQARERELQVLLSGKSPCLEANVHLVKELDALKGQLDRALVAYMKASNAPIPEWRRAEMLEQGGFTVGGEDA